MFGQLKNDSWKSLLKDVTKFCTENGITIPSTDEMVTNLSKREKREDMRSPLIIVIVHGAIDSIITEFNY